MFCFFDKSNVEFEQEILTIVFHNKEYIT